MTSADREMMVASLSS